MWFILLIYYIHDSIRYVISWLMILEIPGYLLDLMHDKNTEIRKLCDQSLEIISVSIFLNLNYLYILYFYLKM